MLEEIGHGGVAIVHRALDTASGREVALKRLRAMSSADKSMRMLELFEREFHALAQLSHPKVVPVYDYHSDAAGTYYTMELLDGGDLLALAPLDYRRACAVMRDVCSALSLIHSRRMVHRDISPRNIRCTADGLAKVIDFGAMMPMGQAASVVGTPAFCAPEVVEMRALDGRADLYSLGAALYFTLTGRHAYPARDFRQLKQIWRTPPPAPSLFVGEIPPALDELVMELLDLDPALRPVSAAEVMERLSGIAELPLDEQLPVSQAYLATPTLVGRERKLARIRKKLSRLQRGSGDAVLVEAERGLGRSRFLEACALEAQLLGVTAVRAGRMDALDRDLGAARSLCLQLLESHPETALAAAAPHADVLGHLIEDLTERIPGTTLRVFAHSQERREHLQRALRKWFLAVSAQHPLAVIIDDVERIDEPSAAFIALLAHETLRNRVMVLATSVPGGCAEHGEALKLLESQSSRLAIGALRPAETESLLRSVFGDVSHLGYVAARIHELAAGNPRDVMELAHHLVDRRVANFRSGSWTLPAALDASDLPSTLAEALNDRVAALSPAARELAQIFALLPDEVFDFAQCADLVERREQTLALIDELVAAGVLGAAGESYVLAQPGLLAPLLEQLEPNLKRQLHQRIAEYFNERDDAFRVGQHLLAAGERERALDVLIAYARASKELTNRDQDAYTRLLAALPRDWYETWRSAIDLCRVLGRPRSDRYALETRVSGLIAAKGIDDWDVMIEIMNQCAHDAGLDLIEREKDPALDPAARLKQAMAAAQERYDRLPPEQRVFTPIEALGPLARASIEAIGMLSSRYDNALWATVPKLAALGPLAPTFSLADKVRESVGARLAGRSVEALAAYQAVLDRLAEPDHAGLEGAYFVSTRDGVICGRGLLAASLGLPSAHDDAVAIENSPLHRLNTLLIRMLHHLYQCDGEAADEYRKQFELLRVQTNLGVQFEGAALFTELCAAAQSDDLTRLRRLLHGVERWSQRYPTWRPMLHFAKGEHDRMRGDAESGLASIRAGLALTRPGKHQLWAQLAGAELRCLLALKRERSARDLGLAYLKAGEDQNLDIPLHAIKLPLAVAMARMGEGEAAKRMGHDVLAELGQLGCTGLPLGLAHHAMAQVSVAAHDSSGFERHATACGAIFKKSTTRTLVMKYANLAREAREAHAGSASGVGSISDAQWDSGTAASLLSSAIETCRGPQERAQLAASLLTKYCKASKACLYVITQDGASLAALVGLDAPPAGLDDYVSDYLDGELGGDVTQTGLATDLATQFEGGGDGHGAVFLSPDGECFHPVLLGHREQQGFAITGVAVLVPEPGTTFVYPGRVAADLSRLALDGARMGTKTLMRYSDRPARLIGARDRD